MNEFINESNLFYSVYSDLNAIEDKLNDALGEKGYFTVREVMTQLGLDNMPLRYDPYYDDPIWINKKVVVKHLIDEVSTINYLLVRFDSLSFHFIEQPEELLNLLKLAIKFRQGIENASKALSDKYDKKVEE